MTGFAGFDRSDYPGDSVIAWLKANTNLVWCGYYLAPAPSHQSASWMGNRAALVAAGWGIAPLYVGRQITGPGARSPNAQNGTDDGNNAVQLLSSEGFPANTAVYLDLENGPPLTSDQEDYIANWCTQIRAGAYTPGIYCSHLLAETVHNLQTDAQIWAFKVTTTAPHPGPAPYPTLDPAGCGYPGARAWQLGQECIITIDPTLGGTLTVDLSTCSLADPGTPNT